MLHSLLLHNVGPAKEIKVDFAPRLNIFTGDNGLGKSFLLDIAWWALTRTWPVEVNQKLLLTGQMIQPQSSRNATIGVSFDPSTPKNDHETTYHFNPKNQAWEGNSGRPANPGLVLYAMVDGSFAVWDPARNYRRTKTSRAHFIKERPIAYVLSPQEVWGGLRDNESAKYLCNGLIDDWAKWQREKSKIFESFESVLISLSPSVAEPFEPGQLTRTGLDDARDYPTIKMPYKQDVPITHLSSAMKRILTLAYMLVWAWEEHLVAAHYIQEQPVRNITLLIDEIEAHLHPRWQRSIVGSLIKVMNTLKGAGENKPAVQLLCSTHAPLVMASLEPLFEDQKDAWFDLDLEDEDVVLSHREFEKQGEAGSWLISEAFDLPSSRSLQAETLLDRASRIIDNHNATGSEMQNIYKELLHTLNPDDSFLSRWRYLAKMKGLTL